MKHSPVINLISQGTLHDLLHYFPPIFSHFLHIAVLVTANNTTVMWPVEGNTQTNLPLDKDVHSVPTLRFTSFSPDTSVTYPFQKG